MRSDNKMVKWYQYSLPALTLAVSLIAGVTGEYFIAVSASVALGLIVYRLMDEVEFDPHPPFPEIIRRGPCLIRFNDNLYPEWLQIRSGDYFLYAGVDYTGGFPSRMVEGGLVYCGLLYKIATKRFSLGP